jgi:hypothetical protein
MEARALLAAGLLAVAAALVWLFGPWGLLGIGVAYTIAALFLVDVKERAREAVAEPDWSERGQPLRR